ncbi:hypothetical protein [Blastococcus saxobsidens]|uniref:Uncharacterized protein n=1 Tax=Blastococcus saxobsidens (strain DD2) TaxID=1146883 RepID=H6RL67_BLASD|nr:hypothetical protein [Blastococcus saxobsidens]CCG01197.1 protein of unknown function [Blastococcus saxobsidens DD2]
MFRNPPEVNYRAVRDMGLAAWFGSSLMGLGVLGHAIPDAISEMRERHRVVDAGWKGTRGLTAGAVTAYVVGQGLVRFDGKPFQDGMPRWLTEGPESPLRACLTGTALGAAVAAMRARDKSLKQLEQGPGTAGTAVTAVATTEDPPEVARRVKTGRVLHTITAACTGALMYSHLKEEMQQKSKVSARFGRR